MAALDPGSGRMCSSAVPQGPHCRSLCASAETAAQDSIHPPLGHLGGQCVNTRAGREGGREAGMQTQARARHEYEWAANRIHAHLKFITNLPFFLIPVLSLPPSLPLLSLASEPLPPGPLPSAPLPSSPLPLHIPPLHKAPSTRGGHPPRPPHRWPTRLTASPPTPRSQNCSLLRPLKNPPLLPPLLPLLFPLLLHHQSISFGGKRRRWMVKKRRERGRRRVEG